MDADPLDVEYAVHSMTRLLVVRGPSYDPGVKRRRRDPDDLLARIDDPGALTELRACLVPADEQDGASWTTTADPTLVLHAGDDIVGTVSVVTPAYVRGPWWDTDVILRHPDRFERWLDAHVPRWRASPW
ncbi:hypothetical protein [Cellulomonas oligotrophica]|uniref:Uncharacterized protein n=1 Tax=Cellulomonas oligotrophica TaxID=931536 RepID=A0A7Y9JYX3_9CELL|nr:hypothetical protein [Cellulomonas oligotrophica]NYD86179.1 hypothetical protein [Cellulomonas oligotrophica]GIG34309.1 hypothetical protein Col01nite_34680 [Cellulomonas oligotrophica]